MGNLFGYAAEGGKPAPGIADNISDRLSKELIIALVGPVGSGVSTVGAYIHDILRQDFAYDVAPIIKLSDIIKSDARHVGRAAPASQPKDKYIDQMQTIGNLLREKFGPKYLSARAIESIVNYRKGRGGYAGDNLILPGRRAYIIDSIKNIEEISLLRQVYGDMLCLVGVFAPDEVRKIRLKDHGVGDDVVGRLISRDQKEILTFGQMTRDVFVESDFFIRNDEAMEVFQQRVRRYLEIVFDIGIHTPTRAESAMYEATATASRSACMSRQVGAAIVGETGELIAVGWNDAPKAFGGLYTEDDCRVVEEGGRIHNRDHRCYNWRGKICHNEIRRNNIINDIVSRIGESKLLKQKFTSGDVAEIIKGTDVESLIEYSRSIHAEMEAILSVARGGRHSLVGSTLYTTTYPCHNCARHIVAAGVSEVVYIEPYRKSLAIDLHGDSISEKPGDPNRVVFRQYDGVAPRKFLSLFKPAAKRKDGGKLSRISPQEAVPVFRIPLDGPAEYEFKVIADLSGEG